MSASKTILDEINRLNLDLATTIAKGQPVSDELATNIGSIVADLTELDTMPVSVAQALMAALFDCQDYIPEVPPE